MQHAPGRGLLRFSGIVFIIFGILIAVLAILAMMNINTEMTQTGMTASVIRAGSIATLIGAAFDIIVGCVGVAYADRPSRATTCIVLGFLCMLPHIAAAILTGYLQWTSITGFLLPLLFIIGGFMNKRVEA